MLAVREGCSAVKYWRCLQYKDRTACCVSEGSEAGMVMNGTVMWQECLDSVSQLMLARGSGSASAAISSKPEDACISMILKCRNQMPGIEK